MSDFMWRSLLDGAARVEHPALRQPVSLIVDDPAPGYNPAHFHSGFRRGPLRIPPTLIDQFADLIEATGIRGKFSVIPNPFGLGQVDREVQGVDAAELDHFLRVVRTRIAPRMDITPEVLTHWNALDLATGRLLPLWEHVWSRQQTRESLIPYLSLALEILNNVDLPCAGMTSPWDFGDRVEDGYAAALLDAQRVVNGHSFTWYFLHSDGVARHVPPRLALFRPESAEAVVSIVTCDSVDFGQALWWGDDPQPDLLLSPDGQGRLGEVIRAGGPAVWHTHWQTIFGHGTPRGLDAIRAITERIGKHFGEQVGWIGCDALARYTAAAAAVSLSPIGRPANVPDPRGGLLGGPDSLDRLQTIAPFPCRDFTLSLEHRGPVSAVRIDDVPLQRAASRASLAEDCYLHEQDRLTICWPLQGTQRISVEA